MKKILTGFLLLTSLSSFAVCGVYVDAQGYALEHIGFYELQSALENRGYYTRSEGDSDIELELNIRVSEMQSCGDGSQSLVSEIIEEFVDPLASVTIVAELPKQNKKIELHKGLPLYAGNGARVRRVIRRLIRKIPKCKTKLIN